MADDYHLLGLGGLTSLITNIKVSLWGNEVLFECLYNPEAPSPYVMVFKDCREMRWDVHDPEEVQDTFADLIGFHLGEDNHREPALIYTDIFEISLLYGSFTIHKGDISTLNSDTGIKNFQLSHQK